MWPGAIMAGGEGAITPEAGRRALLVGRAASIIIAAASALGLFLISHPYGGIVHDSELYVGRAMADADPGGLGRDIFFALEGQSAFSLYPRLSGAFTRAVGPETGALILTLAGLCTWLAGLALFASTLARGRLLWAALVTAATVPGIYGQVFRYAEPFATPRLPAEAIVLAALGALSLGRFRLALGVLAVAAAIHPLMTVPGIAVWLLVLIRKDLRWLLLPLVAGVLLVAAGLAGLPVAERLFRVMDPAWADALSVNGYLFPSRWPATAWASAIVQGTTVALALRFLPIAGARHVLAAILVVASLGVLATLIAADHWLVVLIVQIQPWRALWLLAVAGALGFPIVAVGMWRSGPAGQVALGCLVLGWLAAPLSVAGAVPALAALALAGSAARRPEPITDRVRNLTWIVAGLFGALILGQRALLVAGLVAAMPEGASILGHAWLFWAPAIPVVLLAVVLAARPASTLCPALPGAGAAALLVLAAAAWDDRPALARITDRHRPDPDLVRLLTPGAGELLWLKNGAALAWRLAGRPNWVSYTQGASIVFSPELGRVWSDRMDRLVAAGLASVADRRPWAGTPGAVLAPTREDIEQFCRAPDAPAAIVVPLDGSVRLPDGLAAETYRLPAPTYELGERSGRFGWHGTEAQAVIACSSRRQGDALRGTLAG